MKLPVLEKERIHRDNLVWLLVAQAFSILPLLLYLPVWLVFFWIFAIVWRVQIHRMKWAYPNLFGKMCLGSSCVIAVALSFQGIKSVEPMIAFLVCSFVLKTVELHTKKDALIVLFIGFVAIACQFLFAQDLASGLYGIFSLFILLSAWQAAFFSKGLGVRTSIKRGATLVVQSIPFMVILFVIMPRIGPLWSVPIPQKQGKTGFSETLKLGDIGNLARSNETAFRVSFLGEPPTLNQLYWRGLILDFFDGVEWRAYNQATNNAIAKLSDIDALKTRVRDNVYRYSVVLEPHSYPWLFSLKTPVAAESSQLRLAVTSDDLLVSHRPVQQKSEYAVISQLLDPYRELSSDQRARLTSLPPSGNPRARALAQRWKSSYQSPSDIVQAAFHYYQADFFYTLQPTALYGDTIDQFLFESKNGFCEHFASSFVFLMRSSGIPARLVVGYQGAHYNKVDDYYLIQQSDAHAWAEVWIKGQWQMVDPTTAVAPSRVSLGIEQSLGESDLAYMEKSIWHSSALLSLYHRWDAMGYAWNRWVLNYDTDNQEGLLKRLLGSNSPWRVGLAFVITCVCLFIGYSLLQASLKIRKPISTENKLIMPVINKLSRMGFVREPSESIIEFSERIAKEQPAIGADFSKIAEMYTLTAYNPTQDSLIKLKQAIAEYKP